MGLVKVETLANMEGEEAEDEQRAKEARAVSEDDTLANDIECRLEQDMMVGEKAADVGEYFW